MNGSTKSESPEFKPWNSPHLLTNQFHLLAKLIAALNANLPPDRDEVNAGMFKDLEYNIINVFNHQMMSSWLALAKSYYPFYKKNERDKALIDALEQKLNVKATDFESLSALIKKVFLTKYPKVNTRYQPFIDNIETVMAKLTAVALSTPALINDAHEHDQKQFEEAGPSMANCISPIETLLSQMISKTELDKSSILSATLLLIQVKEIKAHFVQMVLIQKLEKVTLEKNLFQIWLSKQEQLALRKAFKLQEIIKHYHDHLTDVLSKLPKDKKAVAKLARVTEMKNDLEKENVLPSKRIETFVIQLNKATELLKTHRDPLWIRFLSDCLRILALTFSGVAIYKKCTNQSVNFFKPSHGQSFVEEARSITIDHPGR